MNLLIPAALITVATRVFDILIERRERAAAGSIRC
jgi:hypothetical protein